MNVFFYVFVVGVVQFASEGKDQKESAGSFSRLQDGYLQKEKGGRQEKTWRQCPVRGNDAHQSGDSKVHRKS